jgi:hypothetical protein
MNDRPEKLRKPSGGRGRPPKFDVYLDENLCNCKPLLEVLAGHGIQVHRHLEFFQRGTPDDAWLPFVGQKRWALLTTDRRFRYNELERIALQNHNIQAFEFSDNRTGALGMAQALRIALPAMQKVLRRRKRYFVATISKSGQVKVRWDWRWKKGGRLSSA